MSSVRSHGIRLILAATVIALALGAQAQERLGGEFQVNTSTTGSQAMPSVATDPAGNFVIVWQGPDSDSLGIFAQRMTRAGIPSGGEFQVNIYTTSSQGAPAVAMDADGDFVVVWTSSGQDGSLSGVFGTSTYGAGEFQFNAHTTSAQRDPAVALKTAGDFVVVWQSFDQDGDDYGIYATLVPSKLGTDFRINDHTTSSQRNPAVAMDADGDFVVVWDSLEQDGDSSGIFGRRFDSSGNPVGVDFAVNDYTTGSQHSPSLAMAADGRFVVVWESYPQDGNLDGIFGRLFAGDGSALGGDFQVNTYTTDAQVIPAVAMDADGNFVVVWQSYGQDGNDEGIFGQRFTSTGARLGREFQVNTYTTNHQQTAAVAMDANGHFVVVWESWNQDGDSMGVFGQRFRFGELDFFIGEDEDAEEAAGLRRRAREATRPTFRTPQDGGLMHDR